MNSVLSFRMIRQVAADRGYSPRATRRIAQCSAASDVTTAGPGHLVRLGLLSILLAVCWFPNSTSAQIDRLQRTRPLLRMAADFPTALVRAIQFSRDANGNLTLYSAGDDKLVRRWKLEEKPDGAVKLVAGPKIPWRSFLDARGVIYRLDVFRRPEGDQLAFGGIGAKPSQVNLQFAEGDKPALALLDTRVRERETVRSIAFSPNGTQLAIGYDSTPLMLVWSLSGPKPVAKEIPTGQNSADIVRFNPSGSLLAAMVSDVAGRWQMQIYNAANLQLLGQPTPIAAKVRDFCWVDDTSLLIATQDKGIIDLAGRSLLAGSYNQIKPLGQSGRYVVGLRETQTLQTRLTVWGPGTNFQSISEGDFDGDELALSVSPDGRYLAAGGLAPATPGAKPPVYLVRLWRTSDMQQVAQTPDAASSQSTGSALVNVGVIPGKNGQPDEVGLTWGGFHESRRELPPFQKQYRLLNRSLNDVDPQAATSLGRRLLDRKFQVIRKPNKLGQNVEIYYLFKNNNDYLGPLPLWNSRRPVCYAEHPTAGLLAIGYADGILICDRRQLEFNLAKANFGKDLAAQQEIADRAILRSFYGHTSMVSCLDFSPDGTWLVSGSLDGTVNGWSLDGLNNRGQFGAKIDWVLNKKTNDWDLTVIDPPPFSTPAWHAGLAQGQKITAVSVDGQAISDRRFWKQHLDNPTTGKQFLLSVVHDKFRATLGPWKFETLVLQRELGVHFGLVKQPTGNHLVVLNNPLPGTPGFEAGFIKDQVVFSVTVAGEVQAPANWLRVLHSPVPGKEISVEVVQNGQRKYLMPTTVTHDPLWTLYPQIDNQWAIWTPQGHFDVSEDAFQRVEWQVNLTSAVDLHETSEESGARLFEGGDFQELYRDPAILVASGNRPVRTETGALALASTARGKDEFAEEVRPYSILNHVIESRQPDQPPGELVIPPTLAIRYDGTNASLTARPNDNNAISRLELWLNGKLLSANNTGGPISAAVPQKLLRSKGNSLVGVAAISNPAGGAVYSRTIEQIHAANPQPQPSRLHFLGVGVTKLQHEQALGLTSLKFSGRDVLETAKAISANFSSKNLLFSEVSVTALLDDPAHQPPTEQNLKAHLQKLVEAVQDRPDDLVIVMLAGHGEKEPKFRFIAQDTTKEGGITSAQLHDALSQMPCRTVLLLDTCHSKKVEADQQLRDWPGLGVGPLILASCRGDQQSNENRRIGPAEGELGHGAFTAAVLEPLTGRRYDFKIPEDERDELPNWDYKADGVLTLGELCRYSKDRTAQYVNTILAGAEQNPTVVRSVTFPDSDDFGLMRARPRP